MRNLVCSQLSSCCLRTKNSPDARPECGGIPLRVAKRAGSGASQNKVPARTTTADRKWVAGARFEQTLILETLEGGVHRSDRVIATDASGELAPNRKPVGIVSEARDRE
jgi:hypothetical protein